MIYWQLLSSFFSIGLFSVGGGMATVPFLADLAEKTQWFSLTELASMVAVSSSAPGPVGINMATYTGYRVLGIPGAVLAPLAMTLPAFLLILLLYPALTRFRENPRIIGLFYALRPAALGLIAAALFQVCGITLFSWQDGQFTPHLASLILFALVFLCLQIPIVKKLPAPLFLLLSVAAGVLFGMG